MKNKSYLPLSFYIIIFLVVIYFLDQGNRFRREMENNSKITICKFTLCKKYPKSSGAFVKFFLNDTLYRRDVGGCPENSTEKLNKYFILKYSTIDNDKIQVDFSKEITNVEQINELESKLKNWFDLPYVTD